MKYYFLTLLLITTAMLANAQFAYNWSNDYSTTATPNFSNEGRKIVSDANSNIFVLGDFSSDKDSTGHTAATTQYTVRIRKYNFLGNFLAEAYISVNGLINNGFDNRSAFGMELDASGNVYVGYSVLNAGGNFDVVIARYTNALILNWSKTYATSSNDVGVDLKIFGSTAYAVVKSYSGANTTYTLVQANVVQTQASPIYSFPANVDVVNSLAVTGAKNYFVTGYSVVSGNKVAMTACISPTGVIKWKNTYNHGSATGDDFCARIIAGNDGNIYCVGTTYTNAANGNDGMVLKYSASGVFGGTVFMHNNTADVGGAIANGPTGYIYAAYSNNTTLCLSKIQLANFSLTASASYNPVPTNAYLAISGVSVGDLKVAASGNAYVCGAVTGGVSAGNFSGAILAKFGLNGFLFKMLNYQPFVADNANNFSAVSIGLDSYKSDILMLSNQWGNYGSHASENLSINDLDGGTTLRFAGDEFISDHNSLAISLYPNPASDVVTIRSDEMITNVEIADLTGKVLRSDKSTALEISMNIIGMSKGLYICKVSTVNGLTKIIRLAVR